MKLTRILTIGVVAVLLTVGVAATGAVAPGETAQQEEPDSGPEEEPADEADNETDSDESDGELVVTSLYAPDSAAPGDNVTVVAEISNDGGEQTTEQVEFRVGGEVVDRQYVTLYGGESTTVTFTASLAGAETGDLRHGVFTESDGQIATLTVSESFALDSVDAPAEADTGGNATVAATVSNPNDFTTSQPVTFRLEGETVAQETVTLAGGASTTVNFTLSTEDVATGTYVHSVFTRDSGQFLELTVTEPGPDEAAVTFDDQTTNGTSVTVQNLSLPSDGYVVIHNDSLLDGDAVGSVIGVSEYLETGQYEDVTVDLYDVPGATFNASELDENATLIAMPHNETTNDPTYDFVSTNGTADPPFLVDGEAVTDDAAITVADDEPADNETEVPGNETDVPTDNETEAPGNDTDAPVDNGTDAPVDNGTDEPVDNGTDAPVDNGTDAPVDNGTDAPVDNGTDAPVDNGTDAPVDNGTDAPVDNETDAPTDNETEAPETGTDAPETGTDEPVTETDTTDGEAAPTTETGTTTTEVGPVETDSEPTATAGPETATATGT